ncbi:p-aminobenzoyl-glutamate transport protein [Lacunisphaera limnophila]|uniref:p-aminobenzoyl-glutamate transport protein n=1 Tax=Lacunisphaera limnophila TaxID=1838286 RepID=A0A1D8AS75_9BACT|nr:AbgT family transporter [Lacunisphaera limnophila]AOS43753.1 p-aminobenzoyl-glutamate transport protein [Lacunisphaera limnophila]
MTPSPAPVATSSWFQRFLTVIERLGNLLPNPSTLFALLAATVVVLSWIFSRMGVSAIHPATGQVVPVINLLNVEGLHRMLISVVPNFVGFPPLGTVLACLVGIAVAERTGLVTAGLRLIVLATPRRWLASIVVFGGILSHSGADVGYVLFIPLGAAMFHAVGRHPLAGLAAAFAGVSGGFSANIVLGTIDALLAGITQAAATVVRPGMLVNPAANWYFLIAASILITVVGTWVTEKIVEPRLGPYQGDAQAEEIKPLNAGEKRGLLYAVLATLAVTLVILWGTLTDGGFLLDPKNPTFLGSYFIKGLIFFIFFYGLVAGLAYGIGAGTIRNDNDVIRGMDASVSTMGSYIVMAFFASQFLAYFNWTNLGTVLAVKGAGLIKDMNLQDSPTLLMVSLVLFTATVNLVIGSASAKWTLLAPIFVPMFMLLGYTPELVQGAYRVGDSCTNIITPLNQYFPLILGFAVRYVPKTGIGTMLAMMLPYSIAFLIAWTLMLIAWIALGLPVGPGAGLFLPQ